jgi:hypothetical protein
MTINDKLKDLSTLAGRFNKELESKTRMMLDVEKSLRSANIYFPIEVIIDEDVETEIESTTLHTIKKVNQWKLCWKNHEGQKRYRIILENSVSTQSFYSKNDLTNCSEITTEVLFSKAFAETKLETRLEFSSYLSTFIDEAFDILAAKLHTLEEDDFNK